MGDSPEHIGQITHQDCKEKKRCAFGVGHSHSTEACEQCLGESHFFQKDQMGSEKDWCDEGDNSNSKEEVANRSKNWKQGTNQTDQ